MTDHAGVDDGFDDIVQMVDEPAYTAPPKVRHKVLTEQRLPILVFWAKDINEFKAAARWHYDHYRHTWAYHLTRTPLYAFRVAARVPRGITRLTLLTVNWCRDPLGAAALAQVNENKEPQLHHKLDEQHREHVRQRTSLVAAIALAVLAAPFFLTTAPAAYQAIVIVSVIGALAKLGEEHDKPLISRAVVATKAERLTADAVERALWQLAKIRDGDPIRFPSPITRDGAGWRADVDLPPGVTAAEVIEQRDKLAAALRRPQGAVWPEPAPNVHPGRLILWVGDEDMADAKPVKWPLARKGTVNLFDPFPFAEDQRGRVVTICLMFASMVIGAIPRMGKTFSVRLLALAAALDVRAELHLYDLKGTGDFAVLKPVAHRYRAGDDDDDIAYAIADLRELRDEFRRRAKRISELAEQGHAPENKITPELASRASLNLHPIFLAVDECHLWFQHPTYGSTPRNMGEFEQLVSDLTKRGPTVGIFVVSSTQEPSDSNLPTSISRNAVLRFCLKVTDHNANDAVLGTGAHKRGVRATLFRRKDTGVGVLDGEGDEPRTVRAYYVDNPTAERIVQRARVLRQEAGTLSGYAVGEDRSTADVASQLLVDILGVTPSDEKTVWSETLCDRLSEAWPSRYKGWSAEQLAFALKPVGVETTQIGRRINGEVKNQRGVRREWIVEALDDARSRVSGTRPVSTVPR